MTTRAELNRMSPQGSYRRGRLDEQKRILKDLKNERETLAALEHEQWMRWTIAISASEQISRPRKNRWERLWVPYKKLSEKQKDMDRIWADVVLHEIKKLINKEVP